MRLLFIGDVVAEIGCEYIRKVLPDFKRENNIDIVIANGENSANGNGITPFSAEHLFTSGVDIITTGNHVYKQNKIYDMLDHTISILRPANYPLQNPGIGYTILDMRSYRLAVVNLVGNAFMKETASNAFDCIDEMLQKIDTKLIFVDFHAETTSEKRSMGFYLDGRVSAVIGTHTHVQTADEQILENGTAYMTDVGMTGPVNSVLGVKPEITIKKFKTGMPSRFIIASGEVVMNACIIDIDEKTGKATNIKRIAY
ncbi:MAG TPA: TIGR00282 family metallophosphoesterase [Clostridiales bacterium]|nr:TIGR00282 family metallophosphoesterase [Clostridiales bacterium]